MSILSGVITVNATLSGYESMLRDAIMEKLGKDRDALKGFEVQWYRPASVEEGIALDRIGKRLFHISGALGLNDSGTDWKAFDLQVEEGLSDAHDKEVAEKLAHQCLKCVAQMKREAAKNKPRIVL